MNSRFCVLVHAATSSGDRLLVKMEEAALTGSVWIGMRLGSGRLAPFVSCGVRAAELRS